ncbi:Izh3p KNAG_0B05100 [Huiozyma naganishii CBS 8797]|uniref:ADIPOR-like receptor IZH3 n=1 Tax=Huiozyma naganishii (strain ATCC MYA-139 / BCRC 22969 / CBS 8797 / KCTC 17520 / NBRC 10181 / NCYC 3082 / Yp74L-3) TaxID=1071383 RepID=J7RHC7_HUIN7|nr:hypothetical protein KNAG_0B05100 [Kazachstania naganishii CBS 8797]CCK68943.1 hypothetical protein KNAG_0B05100 [Kazachstania naganishii CBS 8797]
MDSLTKLKKKGIDNYGKVKQSGKDFANRCHYSKLVSARFNENGIVAEQKAAERQPLERPVTHHPVTVNATVHRNKVWVNGGLEGESQDSLNSEATTLVNAKAMDGLERCSSRKFIYEDNSKSNSYSTATVAERQFSSQASSPSPSPVLKSDGFESSSSSPTSEVFEKAVSLEDRVKFLLDQCKGIPKHMLKPSEEVEALITAYNHDVAFQEGREKLLHYYELPFPWRENRYIIHNYRFYDSNVKSLLSAINWYGWHNETSNIWSHFLGFFYVVYLAVYEFPQSVVFQSDRIPSSAKFVVYIFLFAAMKCLIASAFWHTFNGTAFLKMRRRFACVDYSGISILITASILTAEFVTLNDHRPMMILYMTISLTLGIIGVFLNCSPQFDTPEARPLRIRFFMLLAAMGVLSFINASYLESWAYAVDLLSPITNKSIVWYLVGVVFYGSFIPERFRTDVVVDDRIPTTFQLGTDLDIITKDKEIHFRHKPTCCHHPRKGIFSCWWVDYVGCSHTFWHIFVVLGVVGHYKAIIDMFTTKWLVN